MRSIGYNIINLVQLLRFFGVKEGLVIFIKIMMSKKNETICFSSKKFSNKVEIRKFTSDLPIFYQVFGELQYDINFFLKYKPTRIIDAGSNVGYSCLYFATAFPESKIVGIEPEKRNFTQLKNNTIAYKNITLYNAALWHETTMLKIKDDKDWSASFEVQKSEANEGDLKSVTISQVMDAAKFDEIDILKIDIEGAEYQLFLNNPEIWLEKTRCLIIELHDQLMHGTSKVFFSAMANYDWTTYIKGENIICFRN